ncbi:hypothetical protein FQR65_LT03862 [Abscondita terminalis]|nr:hypothetical protein FQR65_LT03862 [Abscondita terminalis]
MKGNEEGGTLHVKDWKNNEEEDDDGEEDDAEEAARDPADMCERVDVVNIDKEMELPNQVEMEGHHV